MKNRLTNYSFYSESTRKVKSYGFEINESGDDSTQLAILSYHLRTLLNPGNLVLDRGMLDNLVYSQNLENVNRHTLTYIEDTFFQIKEEYTHVVYFPIEFNAVNDGVRSVNEGWRRSADDKFKNLLHTYYSGKYLTVSGSPMQRLNQILKFVQ